MRLGYLHLPRFPVQRKVRDSPSWAGQPVVMVEESRGARRVGVASAKALRAGVRPGMTLTAATALEPSLRWFAYQASAEQDALGSLGEALLAVAPGFQWAVPDGLWLDASAASLCGGEQGWGRRVLELCQLHGYRGHLALASQLFTARALARYGAQRVEVVEPSAEARRLAPLPLLALEQEALCAAWGALGLSTLGEVAALPSGAVVARMGGEGLRAQRLCRGEDDTPFVAQAIPEVLEEFIGLDWPAESIEPLLFALKTALDRLGARLAGRGRAAVRLGLALGLESRGETRVELVLARPTAQPKMLLELARHRLVDLSLPSPIASLRARVEEACPDPGQQLSLGDEPQGDAALEVVLSRLSTALGQDALFAAQPKEAHRPEAGYERGAFRPGRGRGGWAQGAGGSAERAPEAADEASRERPPRLLPQATELSAVTGDNGSLLSAQLFGRHRRVTAVAGPERLAGEWWGESTFSRDYYRVQVEGMGPVWIYRDLRDGRFYLHGLFD